MPPPSDQFLRDMQSSPFAGCVRPEYHGRYGYVGPAVVVDQSELQAVVRATSVTLQWDKMGKNGLIVYPAC